MRPLHARVVNSMETDAIEYLMWYFEIKVPGAPGWLPSISLAERGFGQADCVLALMRSGLPDFVREAERLIGHRILRCPPCLRPLAPLSPPSDLSVRVGDNRRVVRVCPRNPRHSGWDSHYRFAIFRPGISVSQFLKRGGTRRDVRQALKRGWIELEAA